MALLTPPGIPEGLALGVLRFRDVPAERDATTIADWSQATIKRARGFCDAHEEPPQNDWDSRTRAHCPRERA